MSFLCLLFIFFGFVADHPFLYVVQFLGVLGLLYFVPLLIYLFVALLTKKPGCIISVDGIIDQTQLYGSGFIRWEDIDNITIGHKHTVDFLSIHLHDPNLIYKNANTIKRVVLTLTAYLGGTPTMIDISRLDVTGPDILAYIEHYSNGKFFAEEVPKTSVDDWKI